MLRCQEVRILHEMHGADWAHAFIITSSHDKLTVPTASRHMVAVMPNAELVEVGPAGHPGFLERSVIVAMAVNTDGRREVLGITIGNSEAEPFWTVARDRWPDRRHH